MKKKVLAILLAACMIVSLLPAATAASFGDTEGHWSSESVNRWADAGVLSGDGTGNFQPDKEMTRAEFAQMLCNLMGYTEKAENTFSDVPDDAWYADAILKLNAAGVMSGVGGGKAGANELISREQAAVMLCRAMNIKPSQGASISFGDAGSVSTWARDAVAALTERGMINGVGGNSFAPALNINKASVAAMVDNMVAEYVTENGATITGEVSGVVIIKADNVKLENATLSENVIVAPAAADATVSLTGTTEAAGVVVAAEGAKVVVAQTAAAAGSVSVEAPRAEAQVAGKADAIVVAEAAEGAKVTVAKDAEVKDMTVAAPNTETQVAGKIENVTVAETAKDATVNTSSGAQVGSVTTEAEGTTVSGSGKVDSVTATGNADNTNVSTSGTKTENKTESGSMTDGKGNETKPGESGTSSGGTSSSGGGSSSGGSSGGNDNPGGGEEEPDTTKYTVTFETKGGSAVASQEVASGGKATKPSDPTKEGFTFDKWYKDSACTTEFNFTTETISANTTIYAKWIGNTSTGGSASGGTDAAEDRTAAATQAIDAAVAAANDAETETSPHKHEWVKPGTVPTLTCKESITIECTCSVENCTEKKQITVAALPHDFEGSDRYDADDTQHWLLCKYCGAASETKTKHAFTVAKTGTDATCTTDGTEVKACACGKTQTTKISALGHSYDAGTVTTAATCTKEGVKTYTCTRTECTADTAGHTKTEKIPALGHTMTKTEAKAATCTEAGNKEYWTCSVCKKVFGDAEGKTETTVEAQTIAATGHKVTAWTQSFDDTTPKHTGTCSVCKKSVTENCADADNNGKCDVCGNNMTKAEEPALYTLSLVCEPDGATAPGTITVKPASASGSATTTTSVVEGDVVTLTIAAAEGYKLKAVKVTKDEVEGTGADVTVTPVEGQAGKYTFTMPAAAVTVTATFEKLYAVTIGTFTGGTVTAKAGDKEIPTTGVVEGTTITLTINPATGKVISKVSYTPEGDTEVTVNANEGAYTFEMPAKNVTVTVTFADEVSQST